MNNDSKGVFPTMYKILISHIPLRKLVASGSGAINKSKGKTGKQRLPFSIRYRLGGFDPCFCKVGSSSASPSFLGQATGSLSARLAQQLSEPSQRKKLENNVLGWVLLALGVWLQLRVQECVYLLSAWAWKQEGESLHLDRLQTAASGPA